MRDGGTALLVELGRMSTEPDPLRHAAFLRMAAEDPSYRRFCENKTLAFEGAAWAALAGDMATQDDRLGRPPIDRCPDTGHCRRAGRGLHCAVKGDGRGHPGR